MNNVVGILVLNSRTILGLTKRKVPMKKFIPLDNSIKPFRVATKKPFQTSNVYALVRETELIRIIGNVGDYDAEKEAMMYQFNIRWSNKSLKSNIFPDPVLNRKDFTKYNTISIDPEGCRDIDDALHIRILDNYLIEVGVHIADVSSFVVEGSVIDKVASNRVESVYLGSEQYNMLPDNLATDKCSLIEGEIRRTFTCLIIFNNNTVQSFSFVKGTINNKTMSYEQADKLKLYDKDIQLLYDFGKILYGTSNSYDIHKMVEVYMIQANKLAASLFEKIGIYRVHKGSFVEGTDDITRAANIIKMESAIYSTKNTGHHGLGISTYTHFTSPIRRYADILVHRIIYEIVKGNVNNKEYDEICDKINIQQRHIKKASRAYNKLQLIYSLKNDVKEVIGYILDINDDNVILYLEDTKLIVTGKVYEIKEELNVLDKVNIQLVKHMTAGGIDRKLLVKVLEKIDIKIES